MSDKVKVLEDGTIEYLEEESTVTPEESVKDNSEGQSEPDIPEKYKGKSQEELLKILVDKDKYEGKVANELGSIRKELNEIKKSPAFKTEEETTLEDVEKHIKLQENKLDNLDEFSDDYEKQRKIIMQNIEKLKESKYEIKAFEKVNKQKAVEVTTQAITEFKSEMPADISESIVETIVSEAGKLANKNGEVTADMLHSAAMKVMGRSAYLKIMEVNAQEKVKKQLAASEKLKVPSISTSTPNPKRINIDDDPSKVDSLPVEIVDEVLKKRNPALWNLLNRR